MEMRPKEKKVTNLLAGVRRIFIKFYELVHLDIRKKNEKSKCHIGFSDHLITRDHKKPASVAGFFYWRSQGRVLISLVGSNRSTPVQVFGQLLAYSIFKSILISDEKI